MSFMKIALVSLCLVTLPALGKNHGKKQKKLEEVNPVIAKAIVQDYSKHLFATYTLLLEKNEALQKAVNEFVKNPTAGTQLSAKEAWVAARAVYSPTEAFRFYGGPIDDAEKGPEGLMNAWPLDEGYIDYVQGNPEAGIINNPTLYPKITKDLLVSMNEKDGERNISTGYHAIEFLLWGQDLSLSHAGSRTFEDYIPSKNKFAERRGLYLNLLAELLVEHTKQILIEWDSTKNNNYYAQFVKLDPKEALQKILLGMATLSVDEMSGERMTVPFEKNDQENEQNCFSDTTHLDLVANQKGIQALYLGKYQGFEGVGIAELIKDKNPGLAKKTIHHLETTLKSLEKVEAPMDKIIMAKKNSSEKKHVFKTIELLQTQSELFAKGAGIFGIDINVAAE